MLLCCFAAGNTFAIGVIRGHRLVLLPLDYTLQLRPNMSYLHTDAAKKNKQVRRQLYPATVFVRVHCGPCLVVVKVARLTCSVKNAVLEMPYST